jgi:hypothetical protein
MEESRSENAPSEAERVLRIFEVTSAAVGEEFFRVLVQTLATALRVSMAWVSECVDPPAGVPTEVRTLAFWCGREFGAAAQYAIAGTPCEDVLHTGECRTYPSDLRAAFPHDEWLEQIGAESYMAIPLFSGERQVLGHLALMDRVPLTDLRWKELVLRTFAARAAAELQQRHAQRAREIAFEELKCAFSTIRTLGGLICACAWCGRVRDGTLGYVKLQEFVERNSEANFTHTICPECRDRMQGKEKLPPPRE